MVSASRILVPFASKSNAGHLRPVTDPSFLRRGQWLSGIRAKGAITPSPVCARGWRTLQVSSEEATRAALAFVKNISR